MDCLFCKIVNNEIPSTKIYEDEKVLAFYDIDPKAPTHFLVIPKQHISCASEIDSSNSDIIAHIFEVIAKIVAQLRLDGGYRVVTNCGVDGGQTVGHLHFHILAGRALAWPPG
jgi:histidine triad (HIT) family protein